MAMNRELIGRSYAASTYQVEQEAVVRYARATNETNPCFLHAGDGGRLVAPPVFPVVYHARALAKPIGDPALNIEFKRALHGEQEMAFHRPVRPGDVITTTPSIEDIRDKGTGETIAIRLCSENQARKLVEETLFTLFVRGEKKQGVAAPPSRDETTPTPLAVVAQQLDPDQTFRYSEASGDRVKIHLDPEAAKRAGFPGIIGHGLCTLAFVSRAVVEGVGADAPARLRRISVRFAAPVIPGEVITTRIWTAGEAGEYVFETRDPRGKVVIRDGRAVVEGPGDEEENR
jgi:acyl dehydratase